MEIFEQISLCEENGKYKEIANMLFLQDILSNNWKENKPNMKYYDFISRTIHMLSNEFRQEILYTETPRKPYFPQLIEAYKMVGGTGELQFWKEEKFPLEGIFMRLMFTPRVYDYSRSICEDVERKIDYSPLFLSGLNLQEIKFLANSKY